MLTKSEISVNTNKAAKKATIYQDEQHFQKSVVLYFHGGGLIYGSKDDLPLFHIEKLTSNGYTVISFDYPLAPPSSLDEILDDIVDSINFYISSPSTFISQELPYVLWGRSAGAYLCFLALASNRLIKAPLGFISYYGYGLFPNDWIFAKSLHYLNLPKVQNTNYEALSSKVRRNTSVEEGFSLYVFGRQQGSWAKLLDDSSAQVFLEKYSLRAIKSMPCPIFMSHSIHDTDVPFDEFLELSKKYDAKKHISTALGHDFDRNEKDAQTKLLVNATIKFLNDLH